MTYEEYVKEYAATIEKAKKMSQNLLLYRATRDESLLKREGDVFYTVQEFADIVGVSKKTVQLWDKSGKIKCHHRSPSGYRMYSNDEIQKVLQKYSQG